MKNSIKGFHIRYKQSEEKKISKLEDIPIEFIHDEE